MTRQREKAGVEKGCEIGRGDERAKALQEKKVIARNFKDLGLPITDISQAIGLSIEEIEAL